MNIIILGRNKDELLMVLEKILAEYDFTYFDCENELNKCYQNEINFLKLSNSERRFWRNVTLNNLSKKYPLKNFISISRYSCTLDTKLITLIQEADYNFFDIFIYLDSSEKPLHHKDCNIIYNGLYISAHWNSFDINSLKEKCNTYNKELIILKNINNTLEILNPHLECILK